MNLRSDIRILLLGEPNVGKTTLILSLVSEEFSSKVPARAEEITIPADVTPERVATQIVDYSSQLQSPEQLSAEIDRADVICLVHALNDENSLEKLTSYWLPLVRHTNAKRNSSRTPIVLVGNKSDLITESKLDNVLHIMSEFTEVETCIECSAKTMLNLSETFWFAQKAVLYPTSPLHDVERKELTPACVRALTRVFRICDTDNDGYLSDRELETFQSRCFSVPLTAQSLQDVKQLVRQSCPGGVTLNGITQKGFLFLHLVFVQKGRHETTWTVLRQFGYDNQLRLSNEFFFPRFSVPTGCSTEISLLGKQFLYTLFNKYDLDRDGCLSPTELSELLATCPQDQLPNISGLGDSVSTNQLGWITKQGFMAHWSLVAYLEPTRVLECFAYLGFTYYAAGSFWSTGPRSAVNGDASEVPGWVSGDNDSPSDSNYTYRSSMIRSESGLPFGPMGRNVREALLRSLTVTNEKRLDLIRQTTQRTVFYCRVYGARKVGKTCVLQGLLGRHIRGSGGLAIGGLASRNSGWTAASSIPVHGNLRTLLMHEIGAAAGEHMTAGEALSADVACLVYDVSDPESFRYVANLFLNYYRGTRVPCLFVAAKSDQPAVVQNYQIDPTELTTKYNLCPPEPFSSIDLECNIVTSVRPMQLNESSSRGSDTALFENGDELSSRRQRSGSAEPCTGRSSMRPTVQLNGDHDWAQGAPEWESNGIGLVSDNSAKVRSRNRRFSRGGYLEREPLVEHADEAAQLAPVYIALCSLANYPHLRGLQVGRTDHAWKWTLAATILAGFGLVAFRIARTHL